jgi:H+/Cl- antiporter ClcA
VAYSLVTVIITGQDVAKATICCWKNTKIRKRFLNNGSFGTFWHLITHLFGGSAEGTAVQMGGTIESIYKCFQTRCFGRKTILILGISAGFASVLALHWALCSH